MSKAEKEIVKVVKKTILESIHGVFADPDQGLELKESIKRRLKKASLSPKGFITLPSARRKFA
ncbi:MAG: hypothetical protein UT65_C0015G0024 [Parcubacteria group bacterium GW2011_GWF2_39_8b]|uniref:Uncharacterized protein n=3 Tax=Candidatus Zambryskiibacteriota TaxID=1817925 RepID=A0A1G2T9Y3_9BACT|nr:MAG: hypothetical protein UT65_C0015G0024 [Parcubacteria group bacterium GW2011_GWF2_39_8b]KKR46229.1 MAG: hypothetical protein UT81_C0001G0076 [Parcubacteria group bacterium GW2011_GWA2_40_14]OHA94076.1 MAG: hypothetical protein A2W58_01120 [Candidatus Zambryskibacteria bacterium RIFCSPHIGHO2_02_38_10.5]OHA97284.1 MAG: hypothetical protein A3E32_02290 [Candidatus Zambryskibacteria bacterium RIFCSPHIGHO2_12_FULL_38_37]OHA97413.1 MAG: hypothetical protein A3C63_00120 [Candidatus Zambryskibact